MSEILLMLILRVLMLVLYFHHVVVESLRNRLYLLPRKCPEEHSMPQSGCTLILTNQVANGPETNKQQTANITNN